jgi:prepilin-type processing-associated H-X9-DG protein
MKRKGFTILEAAVVIGVVVILAAILYPVFMRPRECCRTTPSANCQSNLKQIALASKQYIQDYSEKYPIARNSNHGLTKMDNWIGPLQFYIKSEQIFLCRSDKAAGKGRSSYGYNAWMSKKEEGKINDAAIVILNYEVAADPNGWTQTGTGPQNVSASTRHLDGANYSFVDGHVKWLKPGKVTALPPAQGQPTFVPE